MTLVKTYCVGVKLPEELHQELFNSKFAEYLHVNVYEDRVIFGKNFPNNGRFINSFSAFVNDCHNKEIVITTNNVSRKFRRTYTKFELMLEAEELEFAKPLFPDNQSIAAFMPNMENSIYKKKGYLVYMVKKNEFYFCEHEIDREFEEKRLFEFNEMIDFLNWKRLNSPEPVSESGSVSKSESGDKIEQISEPKPESKGYFVLSTGGGIPTKIHKTIEAAEKEIKRIYTQFQNINSTLYILEIKKEFKSKISLEEVISKEK